MTDDRPPNSEEMIRRAREGLEMPGADPAPVPSEPPTDAPRETPLPAPEDTPSEPTDRPAPVPVRAPVPVPAERSRPRGGVLVSAAAGIAGLVVAGIVVGLLRGGDTGIDRDPYIDGVESGITDGMVAMGLDDDDISCVLGTIRSSGAYDDLDDLSDEEIVTLATISPTAPLSDYPPEFRPVADALIEGLLSCVDPSDVEGLGPATADGGAFGDDAALDRLWLGCETDGAEDCDLLYLVSPAGTEYETFGATCGGRNGPDDGLCMDLHGDGIQLAVWRSACAAGDNGACDLLYQLSPLGSEDEAFGTRCGGRDEPSPLPCWSRLGPGSR